MNSVFHGWESSGIYDPKTETLKLIAVGGMHGLFPGHRSGLMLQPLGRLIIRLINQLAVVCGGRQEHWHGG